jgi:hypothetical protein
VRRKRCGKSTLLKLWQVSCTLGWRNHYDSQDLEQLGSNYTPNLYLGAGSEQNLWESPQKMTSPLKLALRLPDTWDVLSEIGLGSCSEQQISLMSQGDIEVLALGATTLAEDSLGC